MIPNPVCTIDDYSIVHTMGEGAYSKVKLGFGTNSNPVALKIFKNFRDETTKKFKQEIELLSKLEHPNIVRILYHNSHGRYTNIRGVDEFKPYIATE
mmetsp:Transcript_32325/g.23364  ORF Transcript_32325/g.23364 Transcript_32325/m.23364 type:complete len:97 (+) Transcript_32325:76-366(+)